MTFNPPTVNRALITTAHTGELYLKSHDPKPLVGHSWVATGRSCVINDAAHTMNGFGMLNCIMSAKKGGTETKWGARLYNVYGARFENIEGEDIDSEHLLYFESTGDLTLDKVYGHNIAAQLYQDAWRGHNGKYSEVLKPEDRLMRGTVSLDLWGYNIGMPRGQGRYGFAVSRFAAQYCKGTRRDQDIVGEIHLRHRDGSSIMVVQDHPLLDIKFDVIYKSCNTIVNGVKKKREAVLIQAVDTINFTGHLEGGDIKIKRNAKTKYSVDVNGRSTEFLWVDGKKIGPLNMAWNG